ncbi:MAG: hypothetical protein HFF60_04570 [Oscillospiraceae bacterium]|jgi:hypothetical protein|nr:hypothetical protein [Oscillospiraceae bacterium]
MTTRLRRLAALLLALALTLSATAFAAEDQRTAQRREDLDVLYSTLTEKHPDLFHRTPESAFLQKKAEIEAELPEMDDLTFAFALQSLVSLAGDSHTTLSLSLSETHLYPVALSQLAEGWVLTALPASEKACIGWTVERVNGMSMTTVEERLADIYSYDNMVRLRRQVQQGFAAAELLRYVGITEDMGPLAIEAAGPGGERRTITLPLLPEEQEQWPEMARLTPQGTPATAFQRRAYFSLDLGDAYYIQYNTCQEDPELPMEQFAAQVERDLGAKRYGKVLIDLRNNGGGSDGVLVPILMLLAPKIRAGETEVWGLVGESTFSSALINAAEIRELGGFLAGTPTGGSVDHFGSVSTFTLPNSGIRGQYSNKYLELGGLLESAAGIGVAPLQPDLYLPETTADRLAGRDTVVEAVLAQKVPYIPEIEGKRPLSRGRFVGMLREALGAGAESWDSGFEDLFPLSWFVPDVVWAEENGVVSGTGAGSFAPLRTITCQEAAVLVERALAAAGRTLPAVQEGPAPEGATAYAAEAVAAAFRQGLLPEGVSPQAELCRADGEAILARLSDALK